MVSLIQIFTDNKIPKEKSPYSRIAAIYIDLILKIDKKY